MELEKNRSHGCGKIFRAMSPCCYQNDSPHRSSPTRTQVPPATDTVGLAKTAGKHGHGGQAAEVAANMENKPPPSVHKALKTDPPVEGNRKYKAQISGEVNKHEGKKTGSHNHGHIEDGFTDYINRAKVKIRTTSNASETMKVDKRHSTTKVDKTSDATKAADKSFSEYINRAKIKIRAMSGVGGGKNDTSKF